MVITTYKDALRADFETLLTYMVKALRQSAASNPKKYLKYSSFDIEKISCDFLTQYAIGTDFENTIELISGQSFPDIIANQYYGVEVKTTKSNHWKSIGSSVAEGTRVQGVERIYMLFGKLASPIDFKCKPYEDCLSEVVVTHSPRYQIDMNLAEGETFFDKLEVPYDVLRKQSNPIKTVLDYYRKRLKPGETTWWADTGESKVSNVLIRLWNSLSALEKREIIITSFCLFPEIFSNSTTKFARVNIWLATVKGIVVPNIRDIFTAGGKAIISFKDKSFQVPRIIYKIYELSDEILDRLNELEYENIKEYWGEQHLLTPSDQLANLWIDMVTDYALEISNFPLKDFLEIRKRIKMKTV